MKDRRMFAGLLILLGTLIVIVAVLLIRTGLDEKPYFISVIVSDSSSARWNAFLTGLQQAEEDGGTGVRSVQIRMVRTNRFSSLEEEKKVIDGEIASGADGIIMEPFSSEGTAEMLRGISARVPVILIDSDIERESEPVSRVAVIGIDDRAAGRALGESILDAFRTSRQQGAGSRGTADKDPADSLTVGVTAGSAARASVQERLRGLTDVLEENGAQVAWFISADRQQAVPGSEEPSYPDGVDAIAALDNTGLEYVIDRIVPAAASAAASASVSDALAGGAEEPYLCGIGSSNKGIYSLDKGILDMLLVPDDFDMGYRSVLALSEYLRLPVTHLSDQQTGFRKVTRDTIFSEENESYLFPIVQ